jgi:tryptophan-rich sensory protein
MTKNIYMNIFCGLDSSRQSLCVCICMCVCVCVCVCVYVAAVLCDPERVYLALLALLVQKCKY